MYHRKSSPQTPHSDVLIRSYWSNEDDAWLAEAVGVPGTRTHADTEAEARDAARELAAEWSEIEREIASLTLDDFARWMDLDERQVAILAAASPNPNARRSLAEWNALLRTATHE
jgi:predicted RNase H-like HicB family nuclease